MKILIKPADSIMWTITISMTLTVILVNTGHCRLLGLPINFEVPADHCNQWNSRNGFQWDTIHIGGDSLNEPDCRQKACGAFHFINSPIAREGQNVGVHSLGAYCYRSEISAAHAPRQVSLGESCWYGWSIYIPETFEFKGYDSENNEYDDWVIVTQMGEKTHYHHHCGGIGHRLTLDQEYNEDSLQIVYTLGYQSNPSSTHPDSVACEKFLLGKFIPGNWHDFVIYAKWTVQRDGFFYLWYNGNLMIEYLGPTWFREQEINSGPNFQMGMYKGNKTPLPWTKDLEFKKVIYTDAFKMGNDSSSYAQVAPPEGETKPYEGLPANNPPSIKLEAETNEIVWPDSDVIITNYFHDDGNPFCPPQIITDWIKISGPGNVTFTRSDYQTTMTFDEAGVYVLRFRADDGAGRSNTDVTINVMRE